GSSFVPPTTPVNSTYNPAAFPGQNTGVTTGNIEESKVGFQSIGSLGVGRISSTNNIGGFVFSAASDSFNLLIRALRVQGRIDILSRPQLMTLDGQTAKVNFGTEYPIVQGSTVTATGIIQQTIARPRVGVNLEVTPKIMPDGRVIMRVIPEVSSVIQPPVPLGGGQISNALAIQQMETTVSAYDGETIVLGGMITMRDNKTENKIPWLGDLPGFGALFRYRTQSKSKVELLIILTPHVVYNRSDAERVLAEEARRMDWILNDVLKAHASPLSENPSALGPVTTVIDGKTPAPGFLETGPMPKKLMPPANSQLPPAKGLLPKMLTPPTEGESASQGQSLGYGHPASAGSLPPQSAGPQPLPGPPMAHQSTAVAPEIAATPTPPASNHNQNSPVSRVVVRNANDLLPPQPPRPAYPGQPTVSTHQTTGPPGEMSGQPMSHLAPDR
ncbi:MAG: hypothetical protein NZO58_06000, partial [Gemmataceae bacterium]|nr:hypothetical protein [Gemmataceae bacterium]